MRRLSLAQARLGNLRVTTPPARPAAVNADAWDAAIAAGKRATHLHGAHAAFRRSKAVAALAQAVLWQAFS